MKEIAKKIGVEVARAGRTLAGQGEQVRFQRDVEQYRKTYPKKTEKDAQKAVLQERFKRASDELRLSGTIAPDSRENRALIGAIKELCGDELVQQFKKDALDPVASRGWVAPPTAPPTPGDVHRQSGLYRTYLEKKLKKIPQSTIDAHLRGKSVVVSDCIQNMRTEAALAERMRTHADVTISRDIKTSLRSNKDLRVELGKLLLAHEAVKRHEKMFERGLTHEKALEVLKEDAKETLTIIFWKAPVDWLKIVGKSAFRPSLESFKVMFIATTQFLLREVVAGSKLLISSTRTLGAYIQTKL